MTDVERVAVGLTKARIRLLLAAAMSSTALTNTRMENLAVRAHLEGKAHD